MAGYKKYSGLDTRPKYSSSERGQSRQNRATLNSIPNLIWIIFLLALLIGC